MPKDCTAGRCRLSSNAAIISLPIFVRRIDAGPFGKD
jgi:hypothetical protein